MKNSRDIWLNAFLRYKGYKIEKYEIISKGKVRCFFNIDDETWKKLKLEYSVSDFKKYREYVEEIKELAF